MSWKSIFSVVVTSHTEPQCQWVCNVSQSFVVRLWNQAGSGLFGLFTKERWVRESAILSHFRQSLCQRDFWRLDWHNEQCITYQRSSLTRAPPPLFIAPSFTFLSFVILFICLVLCFSFSVPCLCSRFLSLPLLFMSSFSFISLFCPVETSQLNPSEPVPSCHLDWKCRVRGDTLSHSYPTLVHDVMHLKMRFLYHNHKTSPPQIGVTFHRSFSLWWWIIAFSHCYSKCHPGIFASSYAH